jgi:hypothetical protein
MEEALSYIFVARLTTHLVIGHHPASELRTRMINRWQTNSQFSHSHPLISMPGPQLASKVEHYYYYGNFGEPDW